jgi:hypothetical protein
VLFDFIQVTIGRLFLVIAIFLTIVSTILKGVASGAANSLHFIEIVQRVSTFDSCVHGSEYQFFPTIAVQKLHFNKQFGSVAGDGRFFNTKESARGGRTRVGCVIVS